MNRVGEGAIAVLAFVCAIVLGLPSLDFPLGGDQGLYAYVGREWFFHGALPYRDVFEQKTPAIFAVHGLAIALFGDVVRGVRVLDFVAVVLCGIFAGIATARVRVSIATVGIATLGAAILYFGGFGFWDLAQCEIWVCACVLGSLAAARRISREAVAIPASGMLAGIALVFKPPALWLVLVCAWVIWNRAARRRTLVLFATWAAVPWVIVLVYFAARGGLSDLYDVLVRANGYYVSHERSSTSVFEFIWRTLDGARIGNPLTIVLAYATLGALFWARRTKDDEARRVHLEVVALSVATLVAVAMQMKFYRYHFGLIVAPGALAVASLCETFDAWANARGWQPWKAPALVLANVVALFVLSFNSEYIWIGEAKQVLLHRTHAISDDQFEGFFRIEGLGFDYRDDVAVAAWLRAHARPDDRVVVRGFEPQIYTLSGLRYGGRFFWTTFLTMPTRAYRRDEWLARDLDDIASIRPRFAVALKSVAGGPDSPTSFVALGYVPRHDIGAFEILERPP